MRLSEFRDHIASDVEFPADRNAVVEAVGDLELDAPDGQPECIREILDRNGEGTYRSADEVYTAVVGCVSDAYVGRKFYDDRGHNVALDHRSF